MALEAASRGADPVVLLERDPRAAATIRRNAEGLGLKVSVRVEDARRAQLAPADLVFLDPPYREDIGGWLRRAGPLARRYLVAEARAGGGAFPDVEGFARETVRSYGSTALALYVRVGAEAGVAPAAVVLQDGAVVESEG
jgi:16S rRNA (guanine966-N2)-methyltransferase